MMGRCLAQEIRNRRGLDEKGDYGEAAVQGV